MKAILVLLVFTVAAAFARADVPAIAFYVVESARLKSLAGDAPLAKISEGKLLEIAAMSGHLVRGAGFDVTTPDISIRASLDGPAEDGEFIYHIAAFSRREGKPLMEVSGVAKGDGTHFATDKWQEVKYAVVFRRMSLKK